MIDGAGSSDSVAYATGGIGPATTDENGRGGTVDVVLNGAPPTTGNGEGAENDSIVNVENVTGGFGNDNLTGDALASVLLGGPGNDTLNGAGGPDSLVGHTGVDNLFGGPGSDQLQAREQDFSGKSSHRRHVQPGAHARSPARRSRATDRA